MQIGERVIEGQIKERGDAKRTYDAAKTDGRKATLVEQERPNLFTTSVAHIGPDEEIVVAIEYQQTLRYDDGTFRAALSAGDHAALHPRHASRRTTRDARHDGIGTASAPTPCSTPIASRRPSCLAAAALVQPGDDRDRPRRRLPARAAREHLSRDAHRASAPDHRYQLTLADGVVPAARDFELAWTPDVGAAPARGAVHRDATAARPTRC